MNLPPAGELLRLQGAIQIARWRAAARRRFGAAGLIAGLLVGLLSGSLLALAAVAFSTVGAVLISVLAANSRAPLAASVAGSLADVALAFSVLTVVISDTQKTGLGRGPLLALPLGRLDLLLADLGSILLLQPSAFVIWPTSLALLIGTARLDPSATWLALPAASGVAVVAAAAALVARRLLEPPPFESPRAAALRPLLRVAAALLPLVWLGLALAPLGGEDGPGPAAPWTLGYWVAGAMRRAWSGQTGALAFGAAIHLLGFGVLALAEYRPRLALPLGRSRRAAPAARWPLPPEWRRIWSPARTRALLAQTIITVAGAIALGFALRERGLSGLPLAGLAALLVAWLVAAGAAPVQANVLGIGGRAAAAVGLVPASAWRLLLPAQAAAILPPALLLAVAAGVLGLVFRSGAAALLAMCAGCGALLAGMGCGAWLSVVWPWANQMQDEGDPVWPPGPGRFLLPLAQGLPLLSAVSAVGSVEDGLPALPAFATLLCGLLLAVLGVAAGCRALRSRPAALTETLLE